MNKKIVIIFSLLISLNLFSQEKAFEFSSSFVTHHYSKLNADRFENKISGDGRTINNPLYAISFLKQVQDSNSYTSTTIFSGKDSINSPMTGFLLTRGVGSINQSSLHLGLIWGLYFYDESAWRQKFKDRKEKTPSWLVASYGEQFNGINMVFGVEVNYQIKLSDKVYFKIKNNLTPMISNHSIGIGFNF